MARISYIKKLRLFSQYKRIVRKNINRLENSLNLRVDDAYRLYTVLNIPEKLIGEAFSLKKSDIDKISESYIREYNQNVAKELNSLGLSELFKSYSVRKVDKYSYLLVIGFSLFKSDKYYDNLYFKVIPILSILVIIGIYFLTLG